MLDLTRGQLELSGFSVLDDSSPSITHCAYVRMCAGSCSQTASGHRYVVRELCMLARGQVEPFLLLFRLGFSQLLVPCFLLQQRERVFSLSQTEVLQEVVRLAQILI